MQRQKRLRKGVAGIMKITIVGAGAMGSLYAALFAEAVDPAHEVWAIDNWIENVAAINAHGLKLQGASGDRMVTNIKASTDVADAGQSDLFVIATKASAVGEAAKAIAQHMGPRSLVITMRLGH